MRLQRGYGHPPGFYHPHLRLTLIHLRLTPDHLRLTADDLRLAVRDRRAATESIRLLASLEWCPRHCPDKKDPCD